MQSLQQQYKIKNLLFPNWKLVFLTIAIYIATVLIFLNCPVTGHIDNFLERIAEPLRSCGNFDTEILYISMFTFFYSLYGLLCLMIRLVLRFTKKGKNVKQ